MTVSPQTMSQELRALGYRKLSARPRHHAQAEGAIEDFKNVWPAPSARGLSGSAADRSASTYPASESSAEPRWRYARPGPHKRMARRSAVF